MDPKTLSVLEYPKILERLAAFCDFSASAELARSLAPRADLDEARRLLAETSEARLLLSTGDLSVGGAHDVRKAAGLAARGGVLEPSDLLDVKSTLIACRDLKKSFEKSAAESPRLSTIAAGLPETFGIVDAVTRVLSERGEVLDSASPRLASLRGEIRVTHGRLMARLQKYLSDAQTASKLQEPIITQRDGRYVIPLRAEFKGQIKAIVHDQSSSGATLFVEPLPVVELNNQVRELQLAERDEERRILAELSALVGAHRDEITWGVEALALLDLAFAKAKYAGELHASEPILHEIKDFRHQTSDKSGPSEVSILTSIHLLRARHPLLNPQTVVPIDVDPKPGTFAIVITGPNTGGKTVSLKTVGLLALMAQSGMHIPAQSGSELACFAAVYADIGDEQSIEQSLSTFSGHITNIIHILKNADAGSLVILDELGAGTDPQEGAALARAILSHLLEAGITTFVATHYPELKTFAHSTEGVVNASLEFDVQTLRPTYRLTLGLPGRSNALAIAQRLGLPEPIIAAARAEIDPSELRADKLLDDIRKERNRASREHEKAERGRQKADALTQELQKRLDKIEDERRQVLARARAEGELEVAVLKQNLESLKRKLQRAAQPLRALKDIEAEVEAIGEKIEKPVERRATSDAGPSSIAGRPLSLGEKVFLASLNSEGLVTALGESDAEVQIGTLRVRAKLSELERRPPGEKTKDDGVQTIVRGQSSAVVAQSPGMEISLRGKLVEDGLDELEQYLEKAYTAGLPFVRIVHGKGTGRMREAVRDRLKSHPYVASFEEAGDREGGAGVTVAKLGK